MADTHPERSTISAPPSTPTISVRPPSHTLTSPSTNPDPTHVPPTSFLSGTWHVTHSSLPMWKKSQNVTITYTVLSSDSLGRPTFDNLVEYQSLGAKADASKKTVKGVEAPRGEGYGCWRWTGKGWLMIASSHWEVLGYGRSSSASESEAQVAEAAGEMERREDDWVVTYFASTLFTPSGIDVYCRSTEGLDGKMLEGIKRVLERDGGEETKKLAEQLFEVTRTGV